MPTGERSLMLRALELAERGRGGVEPNPLVGAVLVRDGRIVGEGWHQRFGGPHAEANALAACTAEAREATLYVTLEPCCHHGKTPPCTDAIIAAGIQRVVAAMPDPFPAVAGGGFERLRAAGIQVEVGLCQAEARLLNAPYLKRLATGKPYVIAKWAASLDGKLATRSGESRWITSEAARVRVHALRGRMDGIVVGIGTVLADDPLLTARPPGPRVAARIVLDRQLRLPLDSQLVRTARQAPVLIVHGRDADACRHSALESAGGECLPVESGPDAIPWLLRELGRRGMTNLLVEGGSRILGSFFDAQEVDEVQVFLAPKIIGGIEAPGPVGGTGVASLADAYSLTDAVIEPLGGDWSIRGRVAGK